ncbi:MAG: hypothetical protein EOO17_00325 [Chloroflexi bacterium]|nr:MAG: hypothetical protein EOO17_00325 [Chloroflexota bacterium]
MLDSLKRYLQRYTDNTPLKKRQRIMALDLLRGLFMVCIVVNHNSGWTPSFINIFTGQGTLFASAAEGFFIISGILVGYIYGPKVLKNTRDIFTKLWKRALLLYILTVSLSILFYSWNLLTPGVEFRNEDWTGNFLGFIVSTFTLDFVYGWHDFLRQYAVFMFFAPFIVLLCAIKKPIVAVGISVLIWLFFGTNPDAQPYASWQIIFTLGIVAGYYLPQIERFWQTINKPRANIYSKIVIIAAIVTYLFSVTLFTLIPAIQDTMGGILPIYIAEKLAWFVDLRNLYVLPLMLPRDDISLFRIFFCALWFSALYISFRKYEDSIENKTRGVLSFFGKNSLFIFCLHGALLFLQDMLIGAQTGFNILLNTVVHIVLLSSVFAVTWLYRRYQPRLPKISALGLK